MAELILDKAPDATSAESRLGYHISAGYGYAAKIINGSDNTGFGRTEATSTSRKHTFRISLRSAKGLTVTVGKFVTPIGAEVIESNANWNYSRGLLFDYAIPFFHFGASAKYAFNPKWALTGYLVNGWNNTIINHDTSDFGVFGASSGLTYGASVAFTQHEVVRHRKLLCRSGNRGFGFNGQDPQRLEAAFRHRYLLYAELEVGFHAQRRLWFRSRVYDFDGVRRCQGRIWSTTAGIRRICTSVPAVNWWGVAGYAKYTLSPKTNFAVRYEYYDDPEGYTGLLAERSETWPRLGSGSYRNVLVQPDQRVADPR